MPSLDITIKNQLGLHARAATKLAKTASYYEANIIISKHGKVGVSAASIMGVMMLAAAKDTVITIKADGVDAVQALEAIEQLINNKFGEDA